MLSPEAMAVIEARYLRQHETPEDLFRRTAEHVAAAEKAYGQDENRAAQEYFELMTGLTFLPNSPALMNAGRRYAQLAACFVLPIEDSLEGIFETLKHTALIHQHGGGTGFSFSRLRPRGDIVRATGGKASGPVSFMQIFDAATGVIKQGAVRSGANMAVLRVDHPDIREFITVKREPDVLNNFNLSVGITDDFMNALQAGVAYDLINPRTGTAAEKVKAREIFDLIVQMAWENGEPGLFFLEPVNRANPTPKLGRFEAPNPCSEQPLLPYESCVLGSINLTKVIKSQGREKKIDFERLRGVVRLAVRFLDNVIDVNCYPLPEVAAATRLTRKIGLGIMGLADLLIILGIPYASNAALAITRTIMEFITKEARLFSAELAERRGPFPAFPDSIYCEAGYIPLRNATVTTIAPTGTISIIANCSSGIEPLFALSLSRRVLEVQNLISINNTVLAFLEERGLLTREVMDAIEKAGSVHDTGLAPGIKQILATAHEIAPEWHVAQLAAAQQFTDNGVSKTVNLPNRATPSDVAEIFRLAYQTGCKGITVYRDGSRGMQVLNCGIPKGCSICN